jgi:hypothetical protein
MTMSEHVRRQQKKRERHGRKEALLLQRYRPDLVLALEVGLALLADEMRQWPAKWKHVHWFTNAHMIGYCWCGHCMHGKVSWTDCEICTRHAMLRLARPIIIPVRQNIDADAEPFSVLSVGTTNVFDIVNNAASDDDVIRYMIDVLQTRDVQ